jgi:hypothetical protein
VVVTAAKSLEGTPNPAPQDSNAFGFTGWCLVAILGRMDQVPARTDPPARLTAGAGVAPGAGRPDLVGEGMARRLERWAAEARVDEAGRQRVQRQWLRRALEEEATVRGVLVDLAERGEAVTVQLVSGVSRHGRLVLVGRDVAGLVLRDGAVVVLALAAVVAIRTGPAVPASVGEPRRSAGPCLVGVLADLAVDRHPVTLGVHHAGRGGGSHVVAGTLLWVGDDLAAVRVEGDAPATAYVLLDAIAEVLVR